MRPLVGLEVSSSTRLLRKSAQTSSNRPRRLLQGGRRRLGRSQSSSLTFQTGFGGEKNGSGGVRVTFRAEVWVSHVLGEQLGRRAARYPPAGGNGGGNEVKRMEFQMSGITQAWGDAGGICWIRRSTDLTSGSMTATRLQERGDGAAPGPSATAGMERKAGNAQRRVRDGGKRGSEEMRAPCGPAAWRRKISQRLESIT